MGKETFNGRLQVNVSKGHHGTYVESKRTGHQENQSISDMLGITCGCRVCVCEFLLSHLHNAAGRSREFL